MPSQSSPPENPAPKLGDVTTPCPFCGMHFISGGKPVSHLCAGVHQRPVFEVSAERPFITGGAVFGIARGVPTLNNDNLVLSDAGAGEIPGEPEGLLPKIAWLRERVREAQFAPEGDNHHNAAACPYCSPAAASFFNSAAEVEKIRAAYDYAHYQDRPGGAAPHWSEWLMAWWEGGEKEQAELAAHLKEKEAEEA